MNTINWFQSNRIYALLQKVTSDKEQDYYAGVPVQQESVRLMTNSKCIIILLSRRYFDSYECREEFRNAQTFSQR